MRMDRGVGPWIERRARIAPNQAALIHGEWRCTYSELANRIRRLAHGFVVVTAPCYMLLVSLAMGIADLLGLRRPRGEGVLGTLGSSLPPLVALIAVALYTQETDFLRSATSQLCGVVKLQTGMPVIGT